MVDPHVSGLVRQLETDLLKLPFHLGIRRTLVCVQCQVCCQLFGRRLGHDTVLGRLGQLGFSRDSVLSSEFISPSFSSLAQVFEIGHCCWPQSVFLHPFVSSEDSCHILSGTSGCDPCTNERQCSSKIETLRCWHPEKAYECWQHFNSFNAFNKLFIATQVLANLQRESLAPLFDPLRLSTLPFGSALLLCSPS